MVTAVTSTPKQNPKRPPLLPSESDNAPPRRPKAREVTSRYLSLSTPKAREVTSRYLSLSTSSSSSISSSSTTTTSSSITSGTSISSRRSQSPMLSRRAVITTPKSQVRAVSAERHRPAATTRSSADRMLVKSVRSLSVSFHGESYSLPVSKVKPPPATVGTPGLSRKGTPERRKAGVTPVRDRREKDRENSRPIDQQQHRWPGRLRSENSSLLTRSLDYGSDTLKTNGSGTALTKLGTPLFDKNSSNNLGNELKLKNEDIEVRVVSQFENRTGIGNSLNSDVESVSSDTSANGNVIQSRGGQRGVVVPAKVRQVSSNSAQEVLDSASPLSKGELDRTTAPSKIIFPKKFQNGSPVSSLREVYPSRGLSPYRGGASAASPCKATTTSIGAPLRGMASPSRSRSGIGSSIISNSTCSTPSMVSFPIDLRRAKLGENRIADAHDLRILYNRQLQWRLANARVERTLMVQKHAAERSLYNTWVSTSKLQNSVWSKGIELQFLRHNLKLYSILKEQKPHLESWGMLDRDYCNSVSVAIKALEASTIRLPIVGGALADVHKVQEAICSAVDVMQAMGSSICSLLMKVEQMNTLVSELSTLSAREHHLLDQCKDFMSTTYIPLQVMQCSLSTHVLQVRRLPTRSRDFMANIGNCSTSKA